MKRLITAISLLTVAGILCGVGFLSMKKEVNTLTQLFSQAAKAAQEEDEAQLHNYTKELQKAWKKSHVIFSMLIQHHDLDDLETDILDLKNLLKEKDFKGYQRACEAGIIELDHIYNSEIPSVGNVF
uniref:DUF4363 family protein n=1 Tax=Candidatus Fimivicinus sp. TaxID=3056640 RepID=UPI003FF02B02